jgi:hypothetical protein
MSGGHRPRCASDSSIAAGDIVDDNGKTIAAARLVETSGIPEA